MDRRCLWHFSTIHESLEMKTADKRCCGSGVCIINDAGECWCGQVWDGEKMAAPALSVKSTPSHAQEPSSEELKPES
jgi:hypothetical protein